MKNVNQKRLDCIFSIADSADSNSLLIYRNCPIETASMSTFICTIYIEVIYFLLEMDGWTMNIHK